MFFFLYKYQDDDHYDRVSRHFNISMFNKKPYNRYKMLKHSSETGNPKNPDRYFIKKKECNRRILLTLV
jgi:hypothetical protein